MQRKWMWPWEKRRLQKRTDAVMKFILDALESGTHPDDILVWELGGEVQWDQPLQTWKFHAVELEVGLDLQVNELVYLVNSRGGGSEHARIVDSLGDGWYTVRFDVENRGVVGGAA